MKYVYTVCMTKEVEIIYFQDLKYLTHCIKTLLLSLEIFCRKCNLCKQTVHSLEIVITFLFRTILANILRQKSIFLSSMRYK